MASLALERGIAVIVRTSGGRPEIRFIWETRLAGYIVTERPGDDGSAVGIPAADVFVYDRIAAEAISNGTSLDWTRLQRLRR